MAPRVLILIIAIFLSFCSLAQDLGLITNRILYTVKISDTSNEQGGYYHQLDFESKKRVIHQLCNAVRDGKLTAYSYYGDTIGSLPYLPLRQKLAEIYFDWDSITYRPRGERDNKVYRYLISNLSFLEAWYFDEEKNIFSKKIKGIILFHDIYTNNIGMRVNYYIRLNPGDSNRISSKELVAKNIIYDVLVTRPQDKVSYDHNWWYNYLEASKRENLFETLTDKAIHDSIMPLKVFKPEYPFDSLMIRPGYANEGLMKLYYGRSNWYGSDPLMFGMTDQKIQACCFELADWTTVRKIRFHEEWYFDPVNLLFEKKVLGIGMIVDVYSEKGDIVGEKCLVYYKME